MLGRAVGANCNYKGHYNENSFLDTTFYEVQFKNGDVVKFGTNTIAMNLYDQVDNEGYQGMTTYEIVNNH